MSTPHQAVILAAGRGSRLSAETATRPKALLPLGPRSLGDGEETSFLRRQVELLLEANADPVVVVAGYLHEQVLDELARWGREVQVVVNPEAEHPTSGSLHSLQCAVRSGRGLFDGSRPALFLDADIVYHREVLRLLLDSPPRSAMLVCARHERSDEEVLVYGTVEEPRFLGKGLSEPLVAGARCLGEAVGIVRLAAEDQALARETIDWMLGDPDAPEGSLKRRGFGPARRATEHEELTQRFMFYRRMRCVVFDESLPFMEVDSAEEYALAREALYPRILRLEAEPRPLRTQGAPDAARSRT